MFDLGFWELLLVALIALLVLGPERLPVAARTLGRWAGRARAYTRSLSEELNREAHIHELRERMEETRREIERTARETEQGARDVTRSLEEAAQDEPPALPDTGADGEGDDSNGGDNNGDDKGGDKPS